MRDQPNIAEESLSECVRARYGLAATTVTFLPLGWDTNAGVYRIGDAKGGAYLLKVSARTLYEPNVLVPRYLRDQGVTAVVAPLATTGDHALWTQLDGWRLTLYPFIEGDTGWATMTDEHWRTAGEVVRRIHQATPPAEIASLHRETFDPSGYAEWMRAFDAQPALTSGGGNSAADTLRAAWRARQSSIDEIVTALETLGAALQGHTLPYVICHADLHAANLIRDPFGAVSVIDWDEVMLAPKERDFLFVGDPPTDGASLGDATPFFQGYGPTEIDWTALTYFRYERVAQDVISYAEEACFRDDLGETTRVEAVERFRSNLSAEGQLNVALRAAAHLPAELGARITGNAE